MDIWKLLFSSVLSVVALFLVAKLMGHKQIAQLDFFDYITGITIGSIAAELATELENPEKPLIAMAVYGACSVLFSFLTNKLPRSRKYLNGTPCILYDAGKLYRENLKKSKLDLSEFLLMCREQGYFDLSELQTVVFETNGRLSILPRANKRPATPEDLSLSPSPAHIPTTLIMDGHVLHQNLTAAGRDLNWLNKKLSENHIARPEDAFLVYLNQDGSVCCYDGSRS